MTTNDTSTGVLDDTRDIDTIVDSKGTSENVIVQNSNSESSAHTGKHAVFNEDEDDLEHEKAAEALGDVTNHHDKTISGKELKTQRSRSALIFDEVDDTREKSPAVQNEDVLNDVILKEDDIPNSSTDAEHSEEHVDDVLLSQSPHPLEEDLAKTSTTLHTDEVNLISASAPETQAKTEVEEVVSMPSDDSAEKHNLKEDTPNDTLPNKTEDVVLESSEKPIDDTVAFTTENMKADEMPVATLLNEDAADVKGLDSQQEVSVDSVLKETITEHTTNDEVAEIVRNPEEVENTPCVADIVEDVPEQPKEEKVAIQEAAPVLSVVEESMEEQAPILRPSSTEDVAPKTPQKPVDDNVAAINENIDTDEVSMPTPLNEDAAAAEVKGLEDKEEVSVDSVHEEDITTHTANDDVAIALKNAEETESTPVVAHTVEDISELPKEEKVIIQETTPLTDVIEDSTEGQAIIEHPEVDDNKDANNAIEIVTHPNSSDDAQMQREDNSVELSEVNHPEKEVAKDVDDIPVPTVTSHENVPEMKNVDDDSQVTEIVNTTESISESSNERDIHDTTSMGHVEHVPRFSESNEGPESSVKTDLTVSDVPEEEIKTIEEVAAENVVDSTTIIHDNAVEESTEAENAHHELPTDDHGDVNKVAVDITEDSVVEDQTDLEEKKAEFKASYTETAPGNQIDLTKETANSEITPVVHNEQEEVLETVKLPEMVEVSPVEPVVPSNNDLHDETVPSTNVFSDVEVKEGVEIVQPSLEEEQIQESNADPEHISHEEIELIAVPPLNNAQDDANELAKAIPTSEAHMESASDDKSGHVEEVAETRPGSHSEQEQELINEVVEHPEVVEASVGELAIPKEDDLHDENVLSATVTSEAVVREADNILKQEIEVQVPIITEASPTTEQIEVSKEEHEEQLHSTRETNDEAKQTEKDETAMLVKPDAVKISEGSSDLSVNENSAPVSLNDHTEDNSELKANTIHESERLESTTPLVDHPVHNNLDSVEEPARNLTVSETKLENGIETNDQYIESEVLPASLQDDGGKGDTLTDTIEKEPAINSSQDVALEDQDEETVMRHTAPPEKVELVKEEVVGINGAVDEVKESIATNRTALDKISPQNPSKVEERDAIVSAALQEEKEHVEDVEQVGKPIEVEEEAVSSEADKGVSSISDEHVAKVDNESIEQGEVDIPPPETVVVDEQLTAHIHNDETKDGEIPKNISFADVDHSQATLTTDTTVENENVDTSQLTEVDNDVQQESEVVIIPADVSKSFQTPIEQSIPESVNNSNGELHEKNAELEPSVIDQKLESSSTIEAHNDSKETEAQEESVILDSEVTQSKTEQPNFSAEILEDQQPKETETETLEVKQQEPFVEINNTPPNVDLEKTLATGIGSPSTIERSPEVTIEDTGDNVVENKSENGEILPEKLEVRLESVEVVENRASDSDDVETKENNLAPSETQITPEQTALVKNGSVKVIENDAYKTNSFVQDVTEKNMDGQSQTDYPSDAIAKVSTNAVSEDIDDHVANESEVRLHTDDPSKIRTNDDVESTAKLEDQQSKIQEQTEVQEGTPILPRGSSVNADAEGLSPHLDNNVTPDSHMSVTAKVSESEAVETKDSNASEISEIAFDNIEEEAGVSQSHVETAPITEHEKAIPAQVPEEILPDVNIEETPAIMEREEDEVHELNENERSAELLDDGVRTNLNETDNTSMANSFSEIPNIDEENLIEDASLQIHEHATTGHKEEMLEAGSYPTEDKEFDASKVYMNNGDDVTPVHVHEKTEVKTPPLQSSEKQSYLNNQPVGTSYLTTTIHNPTGSAVKEGNEHFKELLENELLNEQKLVTSEGTAAVVAEHVKDADVHDDTKTTVFDTTLGARMQGQSESEDQDDLYVTESSDSNKPPNESDSMDVPEIVERPKSPYPASYSVTTIGHPSTDEDVQESDDLIDDNATIPTIRTNTEDNLSETTDVPTIPTEASEESVRHIDEVVHDVDVITDEQEPVTLKIVESTPTIEVQPEEETFVRETSAAEDDARMTQVTPVSSREDKQDEPPISVASPLTTELTTESAEAVFSDVTSPTIVPSVVPPVAMDDTAAQGTQDRFMDAINDVANKKSFELEPLDSNVTEENSFINTNTGLNRILESNVEASKDATDEVIETQATTAVPTIVAEKNETLNQAPMHIQDEAVSEHISEDDMHAVTEGDRESVMRTPVRTPHSMAGETAFSDVVSEDLPPPYEDPLAAERISSSQALDSLGNDTLAGPSVPEKQQTLNVEEAEDEAYQRPRSPYPRSYVVINQGSEPSESSDMEQNLIERTDKALNIEVGPSVARQDEDDEQVATTREIAPIEADDLLDISSSVRDLAEVDEETSVLEREKVVPNLSAEIELPTGRDIARPKTPILSSYTVTQQGGDLVHEDKEMEEPDIVEDLSSSMQTVQIPVIPENRSEIGTIPSEKDFDENIPPIEDELTADDSVSDIAPSDIPEAPNTPRSELSSLASGFDSRSEVSAASRRPVAPASPRLDPDVDINEADGKDSATIKTPVLPSLEPVIKEAPEDLEVETPQPDADTSLEIPPPRKQKVHKAMSDQLSGYSAEDEFSIGADIPVTEEDLVDETDETDGILDVIPEESSLKSKPIDLFSVTTHDSEHIRPLSFTQEGIIEPSNREIELTNDEESIRVADISSHHEDDIDEVSYAESVSVSDDPSISIVDSEIDGHESDISSIATEDSVLSIPVAPAVDVEEDVSSISATPVVDEDRDDASELLSSVAEISQAPPSVSGSKLASVVSPSESGYESDVPSSEIENLVENIETDNITLKPRDEEEATHIMEDEEEHEASLDSPELPVNLDQFSDSSLRPIVSMPSKDVDSNIPDIHNGEHTVLSKAPDHDFSDQGKTQLHVSEEIVSEPVVARRTAIAQRPVSPKTLTPKKKKEYQKHDRVSSGRSWDEIFHPRDDDDEDDVRSRISNGDAESLRGSVSSRGTRKKRGALPTFVFPSAEGMVEEEEPVIVTKPEPLSLHTAPTMQRNDSSTTSSSSPGLLDVSSPVGRARLESTASSVAPFFPGAWLSTPTLPERMSLDTAQGTFYASSKHISTPSSSDSRSPVEAGQSISTDPQGSESEGPVDTKTKRTKKRSRDCIIM